MVTVNKLMNDEEHSRFQQWMKTAELMPGYGTYAEQFVAEELGREIPKKEIVIATEPAPYQGRLISTPHTLVRLKSPERWAVLDEDGNQIGESTRRKGPIIKSMNLKVVERICDGKYIVKEKR